MNFFKTFFIVIALIVITQVHYGSSSISECNKILSSVFEPGKDKNIINFQLAYKNLAINKMFEIEANDSPETQYEKDKKKRVVSGYMTALYNGKVVLPYDKEPPSLWCDRSGNAEFEEDMEYQKEKCKEYTLNYFIENEEQRQNATVHTIFKVLFMEWSEKRISDEIETDQANIRNTKAFFLKHYTLEYFNYIGDYVVDMRKHRLNNFRDVFTFCKDEGFKLFD